MDTEKTVVKAIELISLITASYTSVIVSDKRWSLDEDGLFGGEYNEEGHISVIQVGYNGEAYIYCPNQYDKEAIERVPQWLDTIVELNKDRQLLLEEIKRLQHIIERANEEICDLRNELSQYSDGLTSSLYYPCNTDKYA